MKIANEISYEISYRSHMSEIRIMNSYENYMRSYMRSLLLSITGGVTQTNFWKTIIRQRKVISTSIFTNLTRRLMGNRVFSTVIFKLPKNYRSDLQKIQRKQKLNIRKALWALGRIDSEHVITELSNEM